MLAKVTTTLTGLRARTSCTLALRHSLPRSLSNTAAAATESTRTNEDLVKAAVHRMMLEQQASAGVTEEALQKASYCLRNKLDQVKACLSDVEEEAEENRITELETTDLALEQAKSAYLDLLDLVREADETTAVEFKEIRKASAEQIRELRHALDQYYQEP